MKDLRLTHEKYEIPRSVTDYIPIRCVYDDGLFRLGNGWSKTYSFSDINYAIEGVDAKKDRFLQYCDLLNSLDSECSYKISIITTSESRNDIERRYAHLNDGLDHLRDEYNEMIKGSGTDGRIFTQKKYITVTCYEKSESDARAYFDRSSRELTSRFAALNSRCELLSADERLRILQSVYRGSGEKYSLSLPSARRFGADFRDTICPDYIERHSDYLVLGERFVRALYLKDFASYIKDSVLSDLTGLSCDMILSVDILPISTDEAVREIEKKLLGVETNITNWTRRQSRSQNFSAVIPYDMELQRSEAKEYLNDLKSRDQRMMLGLVTVLAEAQSLEKLDEITGTVRGIARRHMCQMSPLTFQQTDGMNSALPIGVNPIKTLRTLTTESLAVFMPFKVQEINEKGGIYFGKNSVSKGPILLNRENLLNQSAMILGVPGSGKSMCAKNMMIQQILSSNDDILICDPEGEYSAMIRAMNLHDASVIEMAPGGRDRLNAMEMEDDSPDAVAVKSEFILSLISQIDKTCIGPREKSIIDRCISLTCAYARRENIVPTLTMLRNCLLEQSEKEARKIALSLELYTEGTLNIFASESSVDMNSRITVFDIHLLGRQMKSAGLLLITDTILSRVNLNFKKGKRTHVFIDEFHVLYDNEYSAAFFTSAWRQFRKRNAFPTAITQNVEYLLSSVDASTMLSNSEFLVLLNQSAQDREKLKKLLSISDNLMECVKNSRSGSGLLKYGSSIIPFENDIDKQLQLYNLMSTKPGEGVFSGDKIR